MAQIDPSLTERQQYWLKHIRACDAAGKPSVEYARENGIEVSALYSARKALAEKGALPKPPRFQKAAVVDGPGSAQWHIQLPNGATAENDRLDQAGWVNIIGQKWVKINGH